MEVRVGSSSGQLVYVVCMSRRLAKGQEMRASVQPGRERTPKLNSHFLQFPCNTISPLLSGLNESLSIWLPAQLFPQSTQSGKSRLLSPAWYLLS